MDVDVIGRIIETNETERTLTNGTEKPLIIVTSADQNVQIDMIF